MFNSTPTSGMGMANPNTSPFQVQQPNQMMQPTANMMGSNTGFTVPSMPAPTSNIGGMNTQLMPPTSNIGGMNNQVMPNYNIGNDMVKNTAMPSQDLAYEGMTPRTLFDDAATVNGGAGNASGLPTQPAPPAAQTGGMMQQPQTQMVQTAPAGFEQLPQAEQAAPEYTQYESPFQIQQGGVDSRANQNNVQGYINANGGLNDVSLAQEGRQRAEDFMFDQFSSRLDPRFEQEQQQLQIDLRNRGLVEGDAAYDAAMENFERGRNDAYQQAMFGAVNNAGAEAERNFGMDAQRRAQLFGEAQGMSQDEINRLGVELQSQGQMQQGAVQQGQLDLQNMNQVFNQELTQANYQNQVRGQQVQEEQARRAQALNELNALLTGSQVSQPNFNGFNQAGNAGGVDYTGAAQMGYNANLDSFNARQAQIQGLMSGATGIYSAGMFG